MASKAMHKEYVSFKSILYNFNSDVVLRQQKMYHMYLVLRPFSSSKR